MFLSGQSKGQETVEDQRAYLKLVFKPTPSAGAKSPFAIALAQDGKEVQISDHRAELRKAPFDLVISMGRRGDLYVHASVDPVVYERAKNGETLAKTFTRYQTVAIEMDNKAEKLMFNEGDESHQAWFYSGPDLHNFNEVTRIPAGYRCVRRVSNFSVKGQLKPAAALANPKFI